MNKLKVSITSQNQIYTINNEIQLFSFVQDTLVQINSLRIKSQRMHENSQTVQAQLAKLERMVKVNSSTIEQLIKFQNQFSELTQAFSQTGN